MNARPRSFTPAEEARIAAGLAVQPFVAAGVAFLSFPVFLLDGAGRLPAGGYPADTTDAALSVAAGVGIVALFLTLVGVLPTAVWVLKRYRLTLARALLFGLAFGSLPIVFGTALAGPGYGVAGVVRGLGFACVIGLTGAAAFWTIAVRGRDFSRLPKDPMPR